MTTIQRAGLTKRAKHLGRRAGKSFSLSGEDAKGSMCDNLPFVSLLAHLCVYTPNGATN